MPEADSLGRFLVGGPGMWELDPVYVFSPKRRVILQGRGSFDSKDVVYIDSGVVLRFGVLPPDVQEILISRTGDLADEVVALIFMDNRVFVGDTFILALPESLERGILEGDRVRVWLRNVRDQSERVIEVSLHPWEGDTLKLSVPETK